MEHDKQGIKLSRQYVKRKASMSHCEISIKDLIGNSIHLHCLQINGALFLSFFLIQKFDYSVTSSHSSCGRSIGHRKWPDSSLGSAVIDRSRKVEIYQGVHQLLPSDWDGDRGPVIGGVRSLVPAECLT